MTTNIQRAVAIAARTADAHSAERYGRHWKMCALLLVERGYSDDECEAILRSKWMRYAADLHSVANQEALAWFLDDPRQRCTPAAVRELIDQTFGD